MSFSDLVGFMRSEREPAERNYDEAEPTEYVCFLEHNRELECLGHRPVTIHEYRAEYDRLDPNE